MLALFYSNDPVRGTVSKHAGCKDLEINAAQRNSAFINFIIYTCVVPTVIYQTVFREKGLSTTTNKVPEGLSHFRGKDFNHYPL